MNISYLCDPSKNKECLKFGCHVKGGYCYHTEHEKYQKDINANREKDMNRDCSICKHSGISPLEEPCTHCEVDENGYTKFEYPDGTINADKFFYSAQIEEIAGFLSTLTPDKHPSYWLDWLKKEAEKRP